MGNGICGRQNDASAPGKTPQSEKKQKLTKQTSRFSINNKSSSSKKKNRLTIGKMMSFHKIALDKILVPPKIDPNNSLENFSQIKRSLQSMENIYTKEEIISDFEKKYQIKENLDIKTGRNGAIIMYEKQGKQLMIKRKAFKNISALSDFLVHLQYLTKYQIFGIEKFSDLKLYEENGFYVVDIFKENLGQSLTDFLSKNSTSNEKNILDLLDIIKKVSIIIHKLHRKNIAFKTLKPSTIIINDKDPNDYKVFLSIGGSHSLPSEDNFVDFYVKTKEDFQSFDIISLGFIIITFFSPKVTMEDLYKTRSNKEIALILQQKCNNFPPYLTELLKKMVDLESRNLYLRINQFISEAEGFLLKGLQNDFQQDFIAEIFKKKNWKENFQNELFFYHKNKIFFYNESKNTLFIIKVYLGPRKWNIRTNTLCYSPKNEFFYTIADKKGGKIAKIPFKQENYDKKVVEIKSKIEFFYEISQETGTKNEILSTSDGRIIFIGEKIYEVSQDLKENILCSDEIIKNSKNFHYSFLDQKEEKLYILKGTKNFFRNGINFLCLELKNECKLKEIQLKFSLNNKNLLESFYDLNFSISEVYFCIELADNIFLLDVSKVLLVLDMVKGSFHSFSSLFQLQDYEYFNIYKTINFPHTYEVRSLPFPLDFSKGKFFSEEGILHFFCKKDSYLLLCKFILIPNQSCISLLNCKDLLKGNDLMIYKPKEVKIIWDLVQKQPQDSNFSRPLENVYIGHYSILNVITEDNLGIDYKCLKNEDIFSVKKIKVSSLEEFEKLQKNFFFVLENSYLVESQEIFLYEEEKNLYAIIVREHYKTTLMQEFLLRKTKKKYFTSKNLAFLMKCILKAIVYLDQNGIKHGNIDHNNVVFTDKGFVKIKGWYLENKSNFYSDILDMGLLIMECALLEIKYELSENTLELGKEFLEINYPGLYPFLNFILKHKGKVLQINELQKEFNLAYYKMQYKDLDIAKYQSNKQLIFWINYGDNSVITADITTQKHQIHKLIDQNSQPYILSTFNCMTFDLNDSLYLTGNQKDPKVKKQDFFKISLQNSNSPLTLSPLPSIPIAVLNPTMLFHEISKTIYLFGGYQVTESSNKSATNAVVSYNVGKQEWKHHPPMPLALVSATAVVSKRGIYLFGGASEEIDLTGPELNFLLFDYENEKWEFMVNFATKSPFENSRFLQPNIMSLGEEVFLFFQKSKDQYLLHIFELQMGGFFLKFREKCDSLEGGHSGRFLQNEQSLCFNAGVLYNLEETTKKLFIWDIKNFEKTEIRCIESKEINEIDLEFKQFEKQALNSKKRNSFLKNL